MKKICVSLIVATLVSLSPAAFAKTHKENYSVSCDVLWVAVKDVVKNSGKYVMVGMENEEMSISYAIGGWVAGKRVNSVTLNRLTENSCEMQIQTSFSGLAHNDAGDFKQRVKEALDKAPNIVAKHPDSTAKPTPQPEVVEVEFVSVPEGADIEINGKFVGNTPSKLKLNLGDHAVTMKKAGYKDFEKKIALTGGSVKITGELEKEKKDTSGQ